MDRNLVEKLRQAFVQGATPTQLMSLIVEQHGDPKGLHSLIGDYFEEAFGIPLLRIAPSETHYSPHLRHAAFNRSLLPEMIQRIDDWNTADLEGSWLNGLEVQSLSEHTERLQSVRFDELSRIWNDLTEQEQGYIRRKVARLNQDWEVMKCLAALAERLQQQVTELTAQLATERSRHGSTRDDQAARAS